jgi:hypothetical protein
MFWVQPEVDLRRNYRMKALTELYRTLFSKLLVKMLLESRRHSSEVLS